MDWIAPGLALGNWQDARELDAERAGIQAVLQLYGPDACPNLTTSAEVLQLFLPDARPVDPETFQTGVDFIRDQRGRGRSVLVCCGAGMSRSPTFMAAHLCETGLSPTDAFALLLQKRRSVIPHPELLRALVRLHQLDVSAEQLLAEIARLRGRIARGDA